MIQTIFYINNTEVNPPMNWQELFIELNYGKDQFPQGNTVNITDFEWVRENYDLIQDYIDAGLSGGVGIFEGMPFRIDLKYGSSTTTIFNGYIDLTSGLNVKDGIKIIAKSTSRNTVDWINEVANSFSFEYLASLPTGANGKIDSSYYVFMPYINNSVPNYEQAAIATLMVYSIQQTIAKELEEVSGLLSEAGGFFTTIPAVLKLVIKIAYLTVLIATLIKLIQDLIKFIISPVKYHACMRTRDLLERGCNYLGLTFVSDIFSPQSEYYDECIMPQKSYNPVNSSDTTILGFLTPDVNEQVGYYKGTFGQLLDALKLKYNAKIVITANNELIFIRKDRNAQPPVYQLPDLYQPEFTYNTDELNANTLIEFQLDNSETNTLQNFLGTNYQVICQPATVNTQALVMMKNYVNVTIPFSRAFAKTELTIPERIIDDFLEVFDVVANAVVNVVNVIINVVNGITDAIDKIFRLVGIDLDIPSVPTLNQLQLGIILDNRIGMMVLSNDYFSVPKIFILNEGSQSKYNKLHISNSTIESAKAHWDNFYFVNSFMPTQLNASYIDRPTGNQYIIKTFPKVPFTWQNFIDVFTNNKIFAPDGSEALVESLKFNPYKNYAEITVRFPTLYTLNLTEKYLEPDGS